uniref:Pseudouridylate synthase RPUSD2 n=1 Tax=Eptatretus burgeri TaxID=7764 RepID=A0A8C4QBZ0_EPTBU
MGDVHKRKRSSTDFTECIICQKLAKEDLQRVTAGGLPAITYAVSKMPDDTASRLRDELSYGVEAFLQRSPQYHPRCIDAYINKKTVAQKTKSLTELNADEAGSSTDSGPPWRILRQSTDTIDFKSTCLICEKQRDRKGNHKFSFSETSDGQHSIWEKARELEDSVMLHRIQGDGEQCIDMEAQEFRYHESCIKTYLKRSVTQQQSEASILSNDGLKWLITYIDDELSRDKNTIIFLSVLHSKYRDWLLENDMLNTSCRSSLLKKRLNEYFISHGEKVMIVPQKGQSSIICSSSMSVGYLLSKVAQMKKNEEDECIAEESDDETPCTDVANIDREKKMNVYHSAKMIQRDVKGKAVEMKRLRKAEDHTIAMSYDAASDSIPVSLYNYVAWMITKASPELSESGKVELNDSDHEKVLNLVQDMCAAISDIPVSKRIGTALHVLKQTRSKEVVTMLNKFGNCISYQDTRRCITSMAQANEEDDGIFLPSNLQPSLFTQCAIDDLDLHGNTPDCTIMHGTTNNRYQYPNADQTAARIVASVPLSKKPRKAACTEIDRFQPIGSGHTLRDRQQSHSLSCLKLLQESQVPNLIEMEGPKKRCKSDSNTDEVEENENDVVEENLPHKRKSKTAKPGRYVPPPIKKNDGVSFDEQHFVETEYFFENGLRKVHPYYYDFVTYCKGRWIGKTLREVFRDEFRAEPISYYEAAAGAGRLTLNGGPASMDTVLQDNDLIRNTVHRHEPPVLGGCLQVLAETNEVVVVNKPASLPVHPCGRFRHNTVMFVLGKEHGLRGLHTMHRLDRLTSGVLMFTKTCEVAQRFDKLVRERQVVKEYVCRVHGDFPAHHIVCEEPILVMSYKVGVCRVDPHGKPCRTVFKRLSTNGSSSVVLCYPETGRMHQIRVHLQFLGHPVLRDPVYNSTVWGAAGGRGGHFDKSDQKLLLDLEEEYQKVNYVLPLHNFDEAGRSENEVSCAGLDKVEKLEEQEEVTGVKTRDDCFEDELGKATNNYQAALGNLSEQKQVDLIDEDEEQAQGADDEVMEHRECVHDVDVNTSEASKSSKFTASLQKSVTYDSLCSECQVWRPDPKPTQLVMCLHALRYQGPDWEFSTPMPAWAHADWSEDDYLNDSI